MPIAAEKKILTKTRPRTPYSIKSYSTTKRMVRDYLVSVPKIELVVRVALDRRKLSPRFASNGIHTKNGADNLQGDYLIMGPNAS